MIIIAAFAKQYGYASYWFIMREGSFETSKTCYDIFVSTSIGILESDVIREHIRVLQYCPFNGLCSQETVIVLLSLLCPWELLMWVFSPQDYEMHLLQLLVIQEMKISNCILVLHYCTNFLYILSMSMKMLTIFNMLIVFDMLVQDLFC